ncbi:putative immunity protein [Paenibacillus sp. NEAU-GSW1]|uniref:putative immunity protein n=1 Tax=Paenibacillus sp. NEAU-GSW1 TaxID=2682486 RepID=UPI0012E10319|nr:hypothetical protein [Paenibacillus sp. NEAU-GSW1]MUT68360.1 hypothetical protein [Paenibacillus sp. NEAU-GSW1]
MPKIKRKTLGYSGKASTLICELQDLMETQSEATLRKWCLDFAEHKILEIFEKRCPFENRPRNALQMARNCLNGSTDLFAVKDVLMKDCDVAARELNSDPAAQAAARAIGQATSSIHILNHTLEMFFYAAAAIAFDRVGLNAEKDVYDNITDEVCADYTADLQAIAIVNDANPAKIVWKKCQQR